MERPTLVLHKGMRTGGTAFLAALQRLPAFHVLHDPLHELLKDPGAGMSFTGADWPSHHPPDFRYLEGYAGLLVDGRVPGWHDRFAQLRFLAPDERDVELQHYLQGLEAVVRENGRIPILAFHDAEGLWDELHRIFPAAVHVSVNRDEDAQFESWLTQLSHGNPYFFEQGQFLVGLMDQADDGSRARQDPMTLTESELRSIFDDYIRHVASVSRQRSRVTVDVSALDQQRRAERFTRALQTVGMTIDEAEVVLSGLRQRKERDPSTRAVRARLDLLRHLSATNLQLNDENARLRRVVEELSSENATNQAEQDGLAFEVTRILSRRSTRLALRVAGALRRFRRSRPNSPQ